MTILDIAAIYRRTINPRARRSASVAIVKATSCRTGEAVAACDAARTVATPDRSDLFTGSYAAACAHFGGPARFVCGDVAPKMWRRA